MDYRKKDKIMQLTVMGATIAVALYLLFSLF